MDVHALLSPKDLELEEEIRRDSIKVVFVSVVLLVMGVGLGTVVSPVVSAPAALGVTGIVAATSKNLKLLFLFFFVSYLLYAAAVLLLIMETMVLVGYDRICLKENCISTELDAPVDVGVDTSNSYVRTGAILAVFVVMSLGVMWARALRDGVKERRDLQASQPDATVLADQMIRKAQMAEAARHRRDEAMKANLKAEIRAEMALQMSARSGKKKRRFKGAANAVVAAGLVSKKKRRRRRSNTGEMRSSSREKKRRRRADSKATDAEDLEMGDGGYSGEEDEEDVVATDMVQELPARLRRRASRSGTIGVRGERGGRSERRRRGKRDQTPSGTQNLEEPVTPTGASTSTAVPFGWRSSRGSGRRFSGSPLPGSFPDSGRSPLSTSMSMQILTSQEGIPDSPTKPSMAGASPLAKVSRARLIRSSYSSSDLVTSSRSGRRTGRRTVRAATVLSSGDAGPEWAKTSSSGRRKESPLTGAPSTPTIQSLSTPESPPAPRASSTMEVGAANNSSSDESSDESSEEEG